MGRFSLLGVHANILHDACDLVLRDYDYDYDYDHGHDYVGENDASILINYVNRNISLFYNYLKTYTFCKICMSRHFSLFD